MTDIFENQNGQSGLLTPILVQILSGRSGSTLLMQLLGTSSEIVFDRVYPFEVRYLTYLARWATALNEPAAPTDTWGFGTNFTEPGGFVGPFPSINAHYWDNKAMYEQAILSSWGKFSQVATDRSGIGVFPKYYAEKSAPWLPAYLRGVLPYRTILLVRDPRDVFLSISAFNKKRGYPAFTRHKWESDMAFAKRWVVILRKRAEVINVEGDYSSRILVKYEDLISDLALQAQRLGDWLGVELNAPQVEDQADKFSHHMTSESPVLSVNRWRREMSTRLSDFLTRELGDVLSSFGYDV